MPFYFPFSRYPYSYQYRNRNSYCPPYPAVSSQHTQMRESENIPNQHQTQNQSQNQNQNPNHTSSQNKTPNSSSEEENRNCTSKNRITQNSNTISNLFSFLPTSLGPLNFHPEALNDIEEPLFEMFGISLYLDDIIIICILIFLYQEGVKDDMLYISLFLLLIS